MPRLPVVSGREVVRALQRLGFQEVGQRGSHVKLRRETALCIVPLHRELKRGTLSGILNQAELTVDELLQGLAH